MNPESFDSLTSEYLETVVGAKWSTFPGCIGAWVAEMDFGTAPAIKDELRRVVDAGFFGYMPKGVLTRMQEAYARWSVDRYGWEIPVERVRPVPDVIEALRAAVTEFSAAGSKLIVPTPAYMPFLSLPKMLGRELIEVPCRLADGRWELDYDGIDAAFAAGGGLFVHCNPHNPLGRVFERDELVRISEIVDKHGGRVFADEIHAPITYPGFRHIPYASISETAANHTLTATSASKAWNLAGLKCAQVILTSDADEAHWKAHCGLVEHGTSTFGAIANTAAYEAGGPWLDEVLTYLDGNRQTLARLLAEHLPDARYVMPQGTYLAWVDMRETGIGDDVDVFFREHARVAVVNGRACGQAGIGHVRFNLGMSRPMLVEAVTRMASAARAGLAAVGAPA